MKSEMESISTGQDQNGGMCLCENISINLILCVVWYSDTVKRFQKALWSLDFEKFKHFFIVP